MGRMSKAMKKPLVKTLKTLNLMSGTASSPEEILRHRKHSERAHRLATPRGGVERRRFSFGQISCEEIKPSSSCDPDYVILYCHGGGYIGGDLGYAGNLGVKLAPCVRASSPGRVRAPVIRSLRQRRRSLSTTRCSLPASGDF